MPFLKIASNPVQLAQLEQHFLDGVMGRDASVANAFQAGDISAEKRLAIYHNNVFSNYRSALEAIYPAVTRLVGEEYFYHAAHRYIRSYSSRSGDIHHYGREFAELLAGLPGEAELAYLPDTARLEWFIHEAFHAANHERLDLSRLQSIAPVDYGNLRFKLHPAARLMQSDFPVRKIWQVNQPDYNGEIAVDLNQGGEALLIMRRDFVVEVAAISVGEFAIFSAFAKNIAFGDAVEVAIAAEPDFAPGAFLQTRVLDSTLVDFY